MATGMLCPGWASAGGRAPGLGAVSGQKPWLHPRAGTAQLCCVRVPVSALPRLTEQSIRDRSPGCCLAVVPQSSGSQSPQLILPHRRPPPHPSPPLGSLGPRGTRESPSLLSLPQGCFSTFGRTLQRYISLPGTCSLAVLGIEVMREAGDRAGRGSPLCGRGLAQ